MSHFLWQLAIVGLGGALGAMARFAATRLLMAVWPQYLGAGTLVVNVVGSFAIGALLGAAAQRAWLSEEWRIFLVPGLLGGLTTFSALAYETTGYWSRAETFWLGWFHLAANLVLGLGAALAGDATCRWLGR